MTKKEADFTAENHIYFEHSVEIEGYSYLIIFGHHIRWGARKKHFKSNC